MISSIFFYIRSVRVRASASAILDLSKYSCVTKMEYDSYHHIVDGRKQYLFYDGDREIAQLDVRIFNGQICFIYLEKEYRSQGLGRQMLKMAYNDMIDDGRAVNMWAVTRKEHSFWNSIPGMLFQKPVHPSVTGCGFIVSLDNKQLQSYFK